MIAFLCGFICGAGALAIVVWKLLPKKPAPVASNFSESDSAAMNRSIRCSLSDENEFLRTLSADRRNAKEEAEAARSLGNSTTRSRLGWTDEYGRRWNKPSGNLTNLELQNPIPLSQRKRKARQS
jgi:hypothetical protein